MKKTVNLWNFQDAFRDMNRQDNFSYEGQKALFEYLECYEEETEQEIELDVIALCCEFTEYENIKEYNEAYNENAEDIQDIEYNTTVIMIDDTSFIIQDY